MYTNTHTHTHTYIYIHILAYLEPHFAADAEKYSRVELREQVSRQRLAARARKHAVVQRVVPDESSLGRHTYRRIDQER